MRRYTIDINGRLFVIDIGELGGNRFRARVGGEEFDIELAADEDLAEITPAPSPPTVPVLAAGAAPEPPRPAQPAPPPSPTPRAAGRPSAAAQDGALALTAPLPGVIESMLVAPGDRVVQGQELVVLEAMKMRNALRATHDALVSEVVMQPGQVVRYGDVLLRFVREDR